LEVSGLARRFGGVTALAGIDVEVSAGEVFVLLGGSGSGKTTLLRCIAGFERPDAGSLRLNGQDLLALPPHLRPLNTMFQSYALFPHMSVAENIGFGLRHLDRRARRVRVGEMLELVRLTGLGARRPDQLSGGQRQRVALARALARRPALLLLDEPLSALDRALREGTRAELLALQRQLGITFVLVTHDQEEALSMASRIGVMREGRLEQVGPPDEVYERPATAYVASFLGAANVFRGTIMARDAQAAQVAVGGATWQCALPEHLLAGAAVSLAIRPEHISLGPGENTVRGHLEDIAYRGDAYVLTVETEAGVAVRAVTEAAQGRGLTLGTPLTLGWSVAAMIVLAEP
jgi:ABC-type Fe3+/spermidine/putrescine transport system ATPase subunit